VLYSALIGNPTEHSVSHLMFPKLAQAAGIDEFYQHLRLDVRAEGLEETVRALGGLGFMGLNVTLPYKMDVMRYLDRIDESAQQMGAVNTITLGEDIVGYNTDWQGLATSIRRFGGARGYRKAVIFGTGGAARAAVFACRQLGVGTITVLYRLPVSAATQGLLARQGGDLQLKTYDQVAEAVAGADLVINATAAGMHGRAPVPFDLETLDAIDLTGKVFVDAVFKPLQTPLLQYFARRGAIVVDGLWMMVYQGAGALQLWLRQPVKVDHNALDELHAELSKELAHV
jgi:shikimate dehydrogenase